MGEGFPFSSLDTNFPTISYVTTSQLTSLVLDNVPKMVLEIITIIWVGFSRYKIETINFRILCSLESSHSAIIYPSLEFTGVENLLEVNLSVRDAYPLPSFGKLYTSTHKSAIHLFGSLRIVPSYLLEHSWENSLSISLFLKLQGWVSKPSHPIQIRSSINNNFLASSLGTVGNTDQRLTGCSSPPVFLDSVFAIATLPISD